MNDQWSLSCQAGNCDIMALHLDYGVDGLHLTNLESMGRIEGSSLWQSHHSMLLETSKPKGSFKRVGDLVVRLYHETSIPGIAPGIDSSPSFPRPRHLRPSWSNRSRSRADLLSASTSALASSTISLSRTVASDPSSSPPLVFFFRGHRLGRTICWNRGSTHRSSNQVWSLASTS
jgi:hypothetical protein